MGRIVLAFRVFFGILFHGGLSEATISQLGLSARSQPAPAQSATASGGALQMLGILQCDCRLVDFIMEDISAYSDDQVGAAVRNLHDQCRESLCRYVQLVPVIDAIEGSTTTLDVADPAAVKFIGNVPADGRPRPGLLRHKGWRAQKAEFPPPNPRQDVSIIASAEIEIE